MQKGLTKLFLFSTLLSVCMIWILAAPAQAGVVLTEGEFVVMGSDPSAEDYIYQMLFQDMVFEIDNGGKVKGSASVDFSNLDWKGALFSGNATLSLEGNYDTRMNSLSGNFTVNHTSSMKNERPAPLVSFSNNDVMNFTGTVSGGWSTKNGSFEIFFNGNKHSVGKTENSNGLEEEYDRTAKWNNKAVFSED